MDKREQTIGSNANNSVKPTGVEQINPKQNRNGAKIYDENNSQS